MKFDFGEVLGKTWKIGWNHKILWVWQIMPGLFSILIMPFLILGNPGFAMLLPEPLNRLANETWGVMALMGLTFILIIPIMFMSIAAQVTTTYGALQVEKGAEKLAFRGLFNESIPYFWRVTGLYAIFSGAWIFLMFAFMAVTVLAAIPTAGLAMICMMPLFLLFTPIFIVAYSVLELAQAAIIADDMGTLAALSHGWKIFRANVLGVTVLMMTLYFALSMLSSIFIFPIMLPIMMIPPAMESQGSFNSLMVVPLFILFPIIFFAMYVVQGILMVFFQSAWAVAYLRLTKQKEEAPVIIEANA
jgi:hypothetical protein